MSSESVHTDENPTDIAPAANEHVPSVLACRRYVYCIINSDGPSSLGPAGIGSGGIDSSDRPRVFTLVHKSVAAVISATTTEKFDISRANLLDHQRVMERAMAAHCTVLPVKFNTIAEPRGGESAERRIIRCVLEPRQAELADLLTAMNSRAEVGVKGLWPDLKAVFQQLAEGDREIDSRRKRVRAAAADGRGAGAMALQMRLGEMVKKALDDRKAVLEKKLLACLAPLTLDVRRNKTFGDPMFANLALLVESAAVPQIEAMLSIFEATHAGTPGQGGGVRLRCVGPVPPSNFVELVITWDE